MLGYPKLRKANIPPEERDVFERIGEAGLQLTLIGATNPHSNEQASISSNPLYSKHAQEWLTERADVHSRHEWRMELLEWAILIFVIAGVFADLALAFHWFDPK